MVPFSTMTIGRLFFLFSVLYVLSVYIVVLWLDRYYRRVWREGSDAMAEAYRKGLDERDALLEDADLAITALSRLLERERSGLKGGFTPEESRALQKAVMGYTVCAEPPTDYSSAKNNSRTSCS